VGTLVTVGLNAAVTQGPTGYPKPTGPTWVWTQPTAANVQVNTTDTNPKGYVPVDASTIQALYIIQPTQSSPNATLFFQTNTQPVGGGATPGGHYKITLTITATWSDGEKATASPVVNLTEVNVVWNPQQVVCGTNEQQTLQATVTPIDMAAGMNFNVVPDPSAGSTPVYIVSTSLYSMGSGIVRVTVSVQDPGDNDPNDDTIPGEGWICPSLPGLPAVPPAPFLAAAVVPFRLEIRNDNVPGAGPAAFNGEKVAIRTDLRAAIVGGVGLNVPTYSWTIGGTAIRSYTQVIDGALTPMALPAMPAAQPAGEARFNFIWSRPGVVRVTVAVTVTDAAMAVHTTSIFRNFNVRRMTQESQVIYCSDRERDDTTITAAEQVRRSANGVNGVANFGHYEVCSNHTNWHASTQMVDWAPDPAAPGGGTAASRNPAGSFNAGGGTIVWGDFSNYLIAPLGNNSAVRRGVGYSGYAFLWWHYYFLNAHSNWSNYFAVTAPADNAEYLVVPPNMANADPGDVDNPPAAGDLTDWGTVNPDSPPTNDVAEVAVQGGYFGYVRLGEYPSLNQLGKEMNAPSTGGVRAGWHNNGHVDLSRIQVGTPATTPYSDMATVARAPHAPDEVFWKWHTRVEAVANDWGDSTGAATATLAIGADKTSVIVTFNMPVAGTGTVAANGTPAGAVVTADAPRTPVRLVQGNLRIVWASDNVTVVPVTDLSAIANAANGNRVDYRVWKFTITPPTPRTTNVNISLAAPAGADWTGNTLNGVNFN
jgi:hypothetical protein